MGSGRSCLYATKQNLQCSTLRYIHVQPEIFWNVHFAFFHRSPSCFCYYLLKTAHSPKHFTTAQHTAGYNNVQGPPSVLDASRRKITKVKSITVFCKVTRRGDSTSRSRSPNVTMCLKIH